MGNAQKFEKLYRGEEGIGDAVAVCAMGPADLMWKRPFIFYGMHAVTIGHYAIDDRPVEVVDIGERGRSVVGVKYMHGAQLTVMCNISRTGCRWGFRCWRRGQKARSTPAIRMGAFLFDHAERLYGHGCARGTDL